MRVPVILCLLGILLASGCSRTPQFQFSDKTSVVFTYPYSGQSVTLGPSSRSRFIDTVRQRESYSNPKMLQASLPMGSFRAGDVYFEYHIYLIVYRDGRSVHIWAGQFSHDLGDALLKRDDTWRQMLEK